MPGSCFGTVQAVTVTRISDFSEGAQAGFDLQQTLVTVEELMRIIVSENCVFRNEICGLMSPQPGSDPLHWHNALYRIKAIAERMPKICHYLTLKRLEAEEVFKRAQDAVCCGPGASCFTSCSKGSWMGCAHWVQCVGLEPTAPEHERVS